MVASAHGPLTQAALLTHTQVKAVTSSGFPKLHNIRMLSRGQYFPRPSRAGVHCVIYEFRERIFVIIAPFNYKIKTFIN